MQVPLAKQVDVAGFHAEATRLLALRVPPETVEWRAPAVTPVDEEDVADPRAQVHNRAARAIIPQSFVRMSELVVLHRDAERFGVLYRTLWRLVHEPGLAQDDGDADLARLRQMAQAVRRDLHKMRSRLAFQPLELRGRTLRVAWYEPVHFVTETTARWLAAREAPPWLLLTPDRCVQWNGQRLLTAPGLKPEERPQAGGWPGVLEALPWV